MVKETYYDNLRFIQDETDKPMLNQSDVARLLKMNRRTVKSRYGELFKDGLISAPTLARALTP